MRRPAPSDLPKLASATLGALYHEARIGGDFFDFLPAAGDRLVFVMLDVAGDRASALPIAASAQEFFRRETLRLFAAEALNEADVLTDLLLGLNRCILEAAGGVRCAPAFIGCYNEGLGTLFYINAGHMPGLLRDGDGVDELAPSGLPLGLFSHATHDAQTRVLAPGAALLLVSRGLVEAKNGSEEYGLERVRETLRQASFCDAQELCGVVLGAVQSYARARGGVRALLRLRSRQGGDNDATAIALVRGGGKMAPLAGT